MKKILLIPLLLALVCAQSRVFVLCEGNYAAGNASLWQLDNEALTPYPGNPLGDTGQSMVTDDDRLYVILNGSSELKVFQIDGDTGSLSLVTTVNTNYSGPRNMVILNGTGYLTQWYSGTIGVLDLETLEFTTQIPVAGLPEDIVTDGTFLYTSITMNPDWSAANLVQVIDPQSQSVIDSWEVGSGPGDLLLRGDDLYVARTYFDADWNAFAGTSKINLSSGEITIRDYGSTTAFGADLAVIGDTVYRTYSGGVVPIDDDLNIIGDGQIGNFEGIYSMAANGGLIYLGITDDYLAPDQIFVMDTAGNILGQYDTGAIPGSFAFWPQTPVCELSGDVNYDGQLDILDMVVVIDYILFNSDYSDDQFCRSDFNQDGSVDVSDIIGWISVILGRA
ncbi:MAG: hypothetical protein GXO91_00055 [FCB group bacterium]|nr:hypothetical protein [FCB group bacterium]